VRVSRLGNRGGDSFLSPALQRESIERVFEREGLELVDAVDELDRSGGDAAAPGEARHELRRPRPPSGVELPAICEVPRGNPVEGH
jgi:hypothetical protein